jgi:hypothetical protein
MHLPPPGAPFKVRPIGAGMPKKKKPKAFVPPLELRRPIKWTGPLPLHVSQEMTETEKQWADRKARHDQAVADAYLETATESLRRFGILAKQFDADLSTEEGLTVFAFKLAMALCPDGFAVEYAPEKAGAKLEWTAALHLQLSRDVEKIKQEKNCNDIAACRLIISRAKAQKSKPSYLLDGTKAKTLNNRLLEARKTEASIGLSKLISRLSEKLGPDRGKLLGDELMQAIIESSGAPRKSRKLPM